MTITQQKIAITMNEKSYDVWVHIGALSGISRSQVESIFQQEFTPRQTQDLVRNLAKLRRHYAQLVD